MQNVLTRKNMYFIGFEAIFGSKSYVFDNSESIDIHIAK